MRVQSAFDRRGILPSGAPPGLITHATETLAIYSIHPAVLTTGMVPRALCAPCL